MAPRYNPTPDERRALEALAEEVAGVQRTFVANHPGVTQPDRGAHQPQLGGGKVLLHVSDTLPPELAGLGIFVPTGATPRIGIGRMSNGLGCPHAETDADFLGLMVAFRAPDGRRVDFITINDPGAPTDTPEEFVALLKATADAAAGSQDGGLVNQLASQARLLAGLVRHAGRRAPAIAAQVIRQTARTTRSSTAYQQVLDRRRLRARRARQIHLRARGRRERAPAGRRGRPLPDRGLDAPARRGSPRVRPLLDPVPGRSHDAPRGPDARLEGRPPVTRGDVTFAAADPAARETKLVALLAAEMGANQGNWIEDDRGAQPDLPATRFTAARMLAYRVSQRERKALPEAQYASFFETGVVEPALAAELVKRYHAKRGVGHGGTDVGELPATASS